MTGHTRSAAVSGWQRSGRDSWTSLTSGVAAYGYGERLSASRVHKGTGARHLWGGGSSRHSSCSPSHFSITDRLCPGPQHTTVKEDIYYESVAKSLFQRRYASSPSRRARSIHETVVLTEVFTNAPASLSAGVR